MRLRFGTIVALFAFLVSTGALAGPKGVIEMRIDVPGPAELETDLRENARKEITDRVVRRLHTRMDAAGVKFAKVEKVDASTIQIGVEAELGRRLLRGLALAPGRLEVRTIRHIGGRWQSRSAEIPSSVHIRQSAAKLERDRAHLWSDDRETLAEFLDEVAFEDVDVHLYSTGDGWRTYALGATVLTQRAVTASEIRRVSTGAPYVSVQLTASGQKAFTNATEHLGGRLAVVLDGEIVGMVEGSSLSGGALHLSPPNQVTGGDALTSWARQVAGRLAAALPVKIVEVEE